MNAETVYDTWQQARGRGRPRTADAELRQNNYRDKEGHYQLSGGLKPWHERVVDYMILYPNATIKTAAHHFDVSPQWMGMLMKSDAFREYYGKRMRDHQQLVSVAVVSKAQGVATKALDEMARQLETKELPFAEVRAAAEVTMKSLGYGPQAGGVRVNVAGGPGTDTKVFIGVQTSVLEKARQEMAQARKENTKEIKSNPEDFRFVTAAMEVGVEEIEDAVVVSGDPGGE